MSINNKTFIFCVISIYLILMTSAAHAADKKIDSEVVIRGIIKSKLIYSAPYFGDRPKSDSKLKIYYLRLSKAINRNQLNLSYSKYHLEHKYGTIQIWCGEKWKACKTYLDRMDGKTISISGVANYAEEANDIYPITFAATGHR